MHIQVKTLTGKSCQLNIENTTTINQINSQIEQSMGVPMDEQKLILNGKALSQGSASDNGMDNESIIYLLVALEGGKGKKKKKVIKKPKRQHRNKKVKLAILKYYKVEGDKVVRLRKQGPAGTFLAEHKDRSYCGKTHQVFEATAKTTKKGGK